MTRSLVAIFAITCLCNAIRADDAPDWKVGVAAAVITPSQQPIWMAGYAGRTKPSDGVITDLQAKALVIEDRSEERRVGKECA